MLSLKRILRCSSLIHAHVRRCSSTIFALSTGIRDKGSAIAVIRVSGKETRNVLHGMTNHRKANKCINNPRSAVFSQIYHPESGELLDEGIIIWFPSPSSYTGQDLCELHVHGSHASTSAILKALGLMQGLRPAHPGEFTKRAFLNGKMDLIRAEAIADLIGAQTESQRRRAMSGTSGRVSDILNAWRDRIIKLIAHLEAHIDFGEDELIDEQVLTNVQKDLTILANEIRLHVRDSNRKSELIKDGLHVAIIGEPNVGKSTLINILSEKELSIVSPISGTTRDVIETWLNINGYAIRVADTAGIKDLHDKIGDPIEVEGIKRAINRAQDSDLILYMMEAKSCINSMNSTNLESMIPSYLNQVVTNCNQCFYIINKIDLLSEQELLKLNDFVNDVSSKNNVCCVSCAKRTGIDACVDQLAGLVRTLCGNPLEESLFTSERHESHLLKICSHIDQALNAINKDMAIAGFHLRQSASHISHITGKITNEHILDVIFREFCIGK